MKADVLPAGLVKLNQLSLREPDGLPVEADVESTAAIVQDKKLAFS